MRCNLFKTIGSGDQHVGDFFMFSQYTEDITKEQSMKSGYRVVPSKFVALNLDIKNAFNRDYDHIPVSSPIKKDPDTGKYYMEIGDQLVEGCDNIISQIFQSYFENANAFIRNNAGKEEFPIDNWDIPERSLASELLWRTLEQWGFIHQSNESADFNYYDEVKYIGDINIHSNHKVNSYSYDEVFCYIPSKEDEYYYRLKQYPIEGVQFENYGDILNKQLEEWTDSMYPTTLQVINRAIAYHEPNPDNDFEYRFGGDFPELNFKKDEEFTPIPRHPNPNNDEYNFNAIIVFYDVLYSEPGEDPRYLYQNRPMGIYLSGKVDYDENNDASGLTNTFTKFISNNDAYGQGASFGLRIMMRYTPTPNNSTYTMEVTTGGHDYETITEAMGGIADAIVDINRMCKDQHAMYQAYKDHLAQFRNRRVNIPYVRDVAGIPYWFVNGRNTGQPVYPEGYEPRTEYTSDEIINSISVVPQGSVADIAIIDE